MESPQPIHPAGEGSMGLPAPCGKVFVESSWEAMTPFGGVPQALRGARKARRKLSGQSIEPQRQPPLAAAALENLGARRLVRRA